MSCNLWYDYSSKRKLDPLQDWLVVLSAGICFTKSEVEVSGSFPIEEWFDNFYSVRRIRKDY